MLCHTGIPAKGTKLWALLYIGILFGGILAIAIALKRRGNTGGKAGEAAYSAETSAAQAARQMGRGGMGGG